MPLNSLMPELRLFLLVLHHPDHHAGMIRSPPSRAYLAPRRLWLQVCHGLEGGLGMWSAWAYVWLQMSCKDSPASPNVLLRMDVGSLPGKGLGEGNCQGWNWERVGDQPATTCSTRNCIQCCCSQAGKKSSSKSGGQKRSLAQKSLWHNSYSY